MTMFGQTAVLLYDNVRSNCNFASWQCSVTLQFCFMTMFGQTAILLHDNVRSNCSFALWQCSVKLQFCFMTMFGQTAVLLYDNVRSNCNFASYQYLATRQLANVAYETFSNPPYSLDLSHIDNHFSSIWTLFTPKTILFERRNSKNICFIV